MLHTTLRVLSNALKKLIFYDEITVDVVRIQGGIQTLVSCLEEASINNM